MAKAEVRNGRSLQEIGQAIIAAWYKVLPEDENDPVGDIDADELTTLFNQILKQPCRAIVDPKGGPVNIAVPQPPEGVKSRQSLIEYLEDQAPDQAPACPPAETEDFYTAFGQALLFGCGK